MLKHCRTSPAAGPYLIRQLHSLNLCPRAVDVPVHRINLLLRLMPRLLCRYLLAQHLQQTKLQRYASTSEVNLQWRTNTPPAPASKA